MAVVEPNHVLPRTYEWNAALERTLGKADVLTVTYLGAAGRKLMRQDVYNAPTPNFTAMFNVMRNGADSSYEALRHPSVKVALFGLLILPPAWYLHGDYWVNTMLRSMGRRALMSVDVQHDLDSIAVTYQLALTGGVPLLFALHMLSRWKSTSRVLLYLLVPLLFVGTAIAVVLIAAVMHQSRSGNRARNERLSQ